MGGTFIYDIETSPALGLYFGNRYEVNIAKTIQPEYVLGFAYQWLDKKKIHSHYIWDYVDLQKKFKSTTLAGVLEEIDEIMTEGTRRVVTEWAKLVNEAHIVLGHNSDQFDYRQMNGRVVQYKLPPVPRPIFVDTKKMAKRLGYYDSNKLDDLSKRFSRGGKMKNDGIELWWACMNDDPKAKKHMVAYNKKDVRETTALYLDFRPYDDRHPNMANILNQPDVCSHCGENWGFTLNGFHHTRTSRYQRYRCKNPLCMGNNKGRKAIKEEKPDYA